ncbi:hypothetical protein LY76DRAFT_526288 [Colletotrichum caudatum]|nr:hypothetical protein LY76DRAFT_526288 [Colletotrichum caudatum]
MTSNPLVTSLPTIPSTWTAPTSCFASTNYYRVFFSRGDNVFFYTDLYGVPMLSAPTGDCLPPSFTVDTPYITDGGCPAGFTSGCVRGVAPSTVTCCPSVTGDAFVFKCEDRGTYGCLGTATPGAVWIGSRTDINIPEPSREALRITPASGETIQAWGIRMISVS